MNKSAAAFDAFIDDCFVEGDPICGKKESKVKLVTPELLHLNSIQEYWDSESDVA